MANNKSVPKDAQVMGAILKDMGIMEYEPRVVNQMLEFTYRYITNVMEDARIFSSHAKKKTLDIDDIKLAIQMQMEKSFTTPPPRDILVDIARQRNNLPLPLIKPHCGLRLPPDRYCLSACNYHLKTVKKSRQSYSGITPKINVGSVGTKITPAVNITNKSALSLGGSKSSAPTVTILARQAGGGSVGNPPSTTPIIRLSQGPGGGSGSGGSSSIVSALLPGGGAPMANLSSSSSSLPIINPPSSSVSGNGLSAGPPSSSVVNMALPSQPSGEGLGNDEPIGNLPIKRKREDDEDYDV